MSHRILSLMTDAVGQSQERLLYGQVSSVKPAPASFADPLYVVIPEWSDMDYVTVTGWLASHGATLPQQGADVLLALDSANPLDARLRVVWWAGSTTFPSAGSLGALVAANNLSDVANAGTARTNLGLGNAATQNITAFLQLLSSQQLQLSFGTANVTFSTSQTSAQATVAHGLGRVPKFAHCFPNGWFGFLVENGGAAFDNTNFYPIAWSPNTLNGAQGFYWIAIG